MIGNAENANYTLDQASFMLLPDPMKQERKRSYNLCQNGPQVVVYLRLITVEGYSGIFIAVINQFMRIQCH